MGFCVKGQGGSFVEGNSAGGGLTAPRALLTRDRKGPSIIFQMSLYSMIDDRNITPSTYEITDPRVLSRKSNIDGWKMYLGSAYGKEVSPYVAPARATDLTGLPPTYICVGELDPLTIDYANRLIQAEVQTEFHVYPGCYHGYELIVPNDFRTVLNVNAIGNYLGMKSVTLEMKKRVAAQLLILHLLLD